MKKAIHLEHGYKSVPNFSNYMINKEGVLKNILTKKVISWAVTKPRPEKNVTGGYYITNIFRDDGRRSGVSRHRLLGLCFIKKPADFKSKKYTINHVNGVPGDDWIENLEWATYSKNVKHAYDSGLMSGRLRPIIVKHWITGEEVKYPSVAASLDDIQLVHSTVYSRLSAANGIAYTDGYQIKWDDGSAWVSHEDEVRPVRETFDCVIINAETKEVQIFSSLRSAAFRLNVTYHKLKKHFSTDSDEPFEGYIVKSLTPEFDLSKYTTP